MKIALIASAAALLVFTSASCERKKSDESVSQKPVPEPTPQPVPLPVPAPPPDPAAGFPLTLTASTESIQRDLIGARCISCHAEATSANRYIDLRSVEELFVGHQTGGHAHDAAPAQAPARRDLIRPGCPEQSFLYAIMKSGEMPPAADQRLSEAEVEVVRSWIVGLWDGAGDPCVNDEPGGADDGPSDEPGADDGASDEPGADDGASDEPGD